MKTEFEATFINIDVENIRERIKKLWGKCIKENTLMKRVVFENPENPQCSYVRVRDEWWKITCCMKTESAWEKDIHSVKELETEVHDFDAMKNIFSQLWIRQKACQETYREIWEIDGEIECMIDTWPGLKPFIEIEWESEKLVKKYSDLLWFDYNTTIFWTVWEIYYECLGITPEQVNKMSEITFKNPPKNK